MTKLVYITAVPRRTLLHENNTSAAFIGLIPWLWVCHVVKKGTNHATHDISRDSVYKPTHGCVSKPAGRFVNTNKGGSIFAVGENTVVHPSNWANMVCSYTGISVIVKPNTHWARPMKQCKLITGNKLYPHPCVCTCPNMHEPYIHGYVYSTYTGDYMHLEGISCLERHHISDSVQCRHRETLLVPSVTLRG